MTIYVQHMLLYIYIYITPGHRDGLINLSLELFFDGEQYCLRDRHLVLWLLRTLTGQQRFYGSGLIT